MSVEVIYVVKCPFCGEYMQPYEFGVYKCVEHGIMSLSFIKEVIRGEMV